jgi:DNA-binding transcriptional LysR family regulator
MFAKLFAEAGLSLDRLRALVEVGARGSIAQAAGDDPTRQSQYSRQIKELEDFFQTKLVERHGKGIRLTPSGRELARISRFFLLGLSNFQRGCLAEEQTFRIGASATFLERFLVPVLAELPANRSNPRYAVETADDAEIERRLHDLTLDFGVVTTAVLSRPLQTKELGNWRLQLWVPKALCRDERGARQAIKERRLPLALAAGETDLPARAGFSDWEPQLVCNSFLEARTALEKERVAALLPDFLALELHGDSFLRTPVPGLDSIDFQYRLAWNPRLLRLNPHAIYQREFLLKSLCRPLGAQSSPMTVTRTVRRRGFTSHSR